MRKQSFKMLMPEKRLSKLRLRLITIPMFYLVIFLTIESCQRAATPINNSNLEGKYVGIMVGDSHGNNVPSKSTKFIESDSITIKNNSNGTAVVNGSQGFKGKTSASIREGLNFEIIEAQNKKGISSKIFGKISGDTLKIKEETVYADGSKISNQFVGLKDGKARFLVSPSGKIYSRP